MEKSSEKYAIRYLADVPHFLPDIVKAHVGRWASPDNGQTYDGKLAEFQTFYLGRTGTAVCFVAVADNDWAGMIRLKPPEKSGLKKALNHPLIASFQVQEVHRRQGVGRALLCAVLSHALQEGHNILNVWTDSTDYYDRHKGFTFIDRVEKKEGGEVRLYEADANIFLKAYGKII